MSVQLSGSLCETVSILELSPVSSRPSARPEVDCPSPEAPIVSLCFRLVGRPVTGTRAVSQSRSGAKICRVDRRNCGRLSSSSRCRLRGFRTMVVFMELKLVLCCWVEESRDVVFLSSVVTHVEDIDLVESWLQSSVCVD